MADTTGESDDNLTFVYDYNFNVPPDYENSTNVQFAEVNAFYVVNTMHDITYRYGFTESNYNFQNDNFGKGGDSGGDRVLVSVQDNGGYGDAFFVTPPDGQSPTMSLELALVYNVPVAERDSALENDMIAHEVKHAAPHLVQIRKLISVR